MYIKKRSSSKSTTTPRKSSEHGNWRNQILIRDGNKCVICSSKENLHCDHIIPWVDNQDLRFSIENGQTLCRKCHAKKSAKERSMAYKRSPKGALAIYLKNEGICRSKFAIKIGISVPTLRKLIDQEAIPSIVIAYNIEKATHGKVKMIDWLDDIQSDKK